MLKTLAKKVPLLRTKMEESQILFAYRYISLIVTVVSYVVNQPLHTIERKAFIILCLTVSTVILSFLYLIYESSNKNIKILLLIETLGNSLLLIPSGGINSPFIWYTLNTILISAVFLENSYYWLNLFQYTVFTSLIVHFFTDYEFKLLKFIKEEANLVLSFIMIIAAIQTWSIFIKRIKDKNRTLEKLNEQLQNANNTITNTMDQIKALYQTANILSNRGNKDSLIKLLFEHIKGLTKAKTVFYYDITKEKNKITSYDDREFLGIIEDYLDVHLEKVLKIKEPMEYSIWTSKFIIVPLNTNMANYGILGLEVINEEKEPNYLNTISQLRFLTELISMGFEKLYFEKINERLIITEEQNRIANDIHDSVLQRLFSMSCGIFSIIKNLEIYSTSEIGNELNGIRKTTDDVMKELRKKIYGLSWKKSGYNSFKTDIEGFINEVKKFNNINIPFSIEGNIDILSFVQKKSLYRIICETIGNAVQHGSAKNIEVDLVVDIQQSILTVFDDGVGFDISQVNSDESRGIGIKNIEELTEMLFGEIKIISELNNGTKIRIRIPNNPKIVEEVEVI